MKKSWLLVFMVVLVAGVLAACGGNNNNSTSNTSEGNNNVASNTPGSEPEVAKKRIALVLPEPIGVNPFFALMEEGLQEAAAEFDVEVKTIESTDPASIEQNLRTAVAEKYDLIITATFQVEDALNRIAPENPDVP